MYQRTLSRAIREFIELHTRTRPVSNKKPSRQNKIALAECEFDYEYITNPVNRKQIENNIKHRKNVGDINRLLELDDQFRAEKCPGKRETLWQSLLTEANSLPNKTHPTVQGYEGRPKVLKCSEHVVHSFLPKTFMELAKDLRLLRTEDLATVTGSRSYYFIGDLAELEFALIKFTISRLLKKNFNVVSVPDILPAEVLERCGMTQNSMQTQVYYLDETHGSNLCLSGTSEMALAALFSNTIFSSKELPTCVTAVSRCYRAEVSSIAEEKGIYRVHQFTKVEMFGISHPNESEQMMQNFVDIQEEMFSSLGLDYQILDMPMHELGASAYRKHDIEAWYPGKEMYGEISSCSNCTDYQSRRLNIKYKDGDKLRHVHTVNGTACAIPRMLMALFETHQQQNGNIRLPEPLRPFLNGKEEIQLQNVIPKLTSKVKESRKSSS
ncbi:hypothetical protein RUM44_000635 [Polyplax serrata]|uniref:serine--tRNA ligase n=1 Tax=Polyplax serrata TaxID=468196 RepID=A0ABR1B619_POLSC